MNGKINILGFAGSLRKKSYNRALLSAALEMVPDEATLEVFDLEGIPPFNQDIEKQPPESVRRFKEKIRAADAILIATPEYNFSIPGVLKNAIDWASRPYGDNALNEKPVALMGASIGIFGTARAQYHLRQCFVCLNMYPLNAPEVMVASAHEKIDDDGILKDGETKQKVGKLLVSLVAWTKKIAGSSASGE
ncbi:MAG TPA: NAD(P)H-dependent oxidoreductase [Syntrophales bacterium]|nr:NAD(P)H-dependent oxidoreductase [Syntrophales bacterium]HRT71432.1 NAD(P)H-dependent oxidoreductase [Syntrophales bacterium]